MADLVSGGQRLEKEPAVPRGPTCCSNPNVLRSPDELQAAVKDLTRMTVVVSTAVSGDERTLKKTETTRETLGSQLVAGIQQEVRVDKCGCCTRCSSAAQATLTRCCSALGRADGRGRAVLALCGGARLVLQQRHSPRRLVYSGLHLWVFECLAGGDEAAPAEEAAGVPQWHATSVPPFVRRHLSLHFCFHLTSRSQTIRSRTFSIGWARV